MGTPTAAAERRPATAEAVAAARGVGAWTARQRERAGIIPSYRPTKRAVRYDPEEVLAALRQRQQDAERE